MNKPDCRNKADKYSSYSMAFVTCLSRWVLHCFRWKSSDRRCNFAAWEDVLKSEALLPIASAETSRDSTEADSFFDPLWTWQKDEQRKCAISPGLKSMECLRICLEWFSELPGFSLDLASCLAEGSRPAEQPPVINTKRETSGTRL